MATLVWKTWEDFDLKKINLYNIQFAYDYRATPNTFVADYGGLRDEFRGYGFTYGADGYPTGGTVTSYYSKSYSGTQGYITGASISAASLAAAARTASKSDDLAIYKAVLSGSDRITGGKGDDKLEGFAGNDKITGGWGKDKLYGGSGADTFIYKDTYDAAWENGGETIFDFSKGQRDKIDLRSIDADIFTPGNQAFTFIGTQQFSGQAGELRYERVASGIKISGDTYGDGETEFYIVLRGVTSITKSYFML
jgi:Ca2+-binding RTX toxin-like protein